MNSRFLTRRKAMLTCTAVFAGLGHARAASTSASTPTPTQGATPASPPMPAPGPPRPAVAAQPGARVVIALHDSRLEPRLTAASVHTHGAMPLEWLGLTVIYNDIATQPLPQAWADPDCRGVLIWFPQQNIDRFADFVGWVEQTIAAGRKVVLLGDAAPKPGALPEAEADRLRARMYAALGIRALGDWSATTFGDRLVPTAFGIGGFERSFPDLLPNYEIMEPATPDTTSFLVVERASNPRRTSHVAMTTRSGGVVASGWETVQDPRSDTQGWFIDPFAFFEAAFEVADLPRVDTTTLCGRRIYYSHIDGDGWRSLSKVHLGAGASLTTAEIILQQVIAPNPDLPVTVAPIAAEMDMARSGNQRAIDAAKALFALPQVEAATHTYTHPFQWAFFEHYTAEKEAPFAPAYKEVAEGHKQLVEAGASAEPCCTRAGAYAVPRAFGDRPFDLREEVRGSKQLIETLCPPGKSVGLLQWPGDCQPFDAALREVAGAGMLNINGGDTRFDDANPTVSSVRPVGIRRGDVVQIYASNSSEELYTQLWTNQFFGYRDLPDTWDRTEMPRRLKPMNMYYHMYSGERLASLQALQANVAALRKREFIGVKASRFAAIGAGFFRAQLQREGPGWRVRERGGLATLRFGRGSRRMVDLAASDGVLGERLVGDELYVALDPANPAPLVVLAARTGAPPPQPSLVSANWEVSRLRTASGGWQFHAAGLGAGALGWRVPQGGAWIATAPGWQERLGVGADLALALALPPIGLEGVDISISRDSQA